MSQAAPLLSLLGENFAQISTLGLHGNTLYDVLPETQGTGNVTVNATMMDVSCGLVPNFTATALNNASRYSLDSIFDDRWDISSTIPIMGARL
jgi:hypothetical protein